MSSALADGEGEVDRYSPWQLHRWKHFIRLNPRPNSNRPLRD